MMIDGMNSYEILNNNRMVTQDGHKSWYNAARKTEQVMQAEEVGGLQVDIEQSGLSCLDLRSCSRFRAKSPLCIGFVGTP
jgi:hypothetical protein